MALDFPPGTTGATYTGPGGVIWVWDGAKWVSGTLTTGIYAPITNDVGRNLVHNSMFNIAQRGAGPFGANVYTLDRWKNFTVLDTVSISQVAFGVAGMALDEAAAFALGNTFTGNAGATAYNTIFQNIEDVRRLANKTATVSFYANASATLKLGVSLAQSFGTGGSPSANVSVNGQSVTVGGGYARYSLTFTLPSIAGKTLGTNPDHSTILYFWYSAGATTSPNVGNIGVQSGIVYLWGVQLELGTVATPLEKLDPVTQLQQCQRFFQIVAAGARGTGAGGIPMASFPTWPPMRATPAATLNTAGSRANVGASTMTPFNASSGFFNVATSGAGDGYVLSELYNLSADL